MPKNISLLRLILTWTMIWGCLGSKAFAISPESPQVQGMIRRAITYLGSAPDDPRIGAKALIGLTFVKRNQPEHPKVVSATEACLAMSRMKFEEVKALNEIYSLGLAIIFLCELDPIQYRGPIDLLLSDLFELQKEAGAWGYASGANESSCDTSMSQYAVLAIWTATRSGIYLPQDKLRKACEWLIRTQDPSGAWGYQGIVNDPKSFTRTAQSEIRPSMAAAGLGSLYVCADLMEVKNTRAAEKALYSSLPKVLVPVDPSELEGKGAVASQALAAMINRGLLDGEGWFEQNFVVEAKDYNYYYLYALERYKSFAELKSGTKEKEAAWYDTSVKFLADKQSANGAWVGGSEGDAVGTAFATLFLMRGTRKSIQAASLGAGTLAGGRGLPHDLSGVRIKGQKIVAPKLTASASDVLGMLGEAANDLEAYSEAEAEVTMSSDTQQRADQVERFRGIVLRGDEIARRVAIQALAATRDLANVPAFLVALESQDSKTVLAARDALRVLSRQPSGFGPPDQFSEADQRNAVKAWQEWYQGLVPGD